MFNIRMFLNLFHKSVFACSNVRSCSANKNVRCSVTPDICILEIKFKTKLGRILAVAITKIQDIMIKRMNHVSDKIIEYQREVINSLLTFDILQAHLTPAHIQNCCFEDFEYVYKQALSIKEVRWLFS